MALVDWRSEFETGIASVDHEHRELIGLINALHMVIGQGATRARVAGFLGEVLARIAAHFALEEAMMRQHRYDDYAAHKADHERLLDELRDIMDANEHDGEADAAAELGRAVHDWFVVHFKTRDARLHRTLGR